MLVLLFAAAMISAASADTILLNLGDSFRDTVDAYPAGTTFRIASGVHRLQEIRAKDGNSFIGDSGAVLSGARVLDAWEKRGEYWVHGGQEQQGEENGSCLDGTNDCRFSEDLYADGEFLRQVEFLDSLDTLSEWYFDYDNDEVYMLMDTAGHEFEISVATHAVRGGFGRASTGDTTSVTDITIRNLVIEKYAAPMQQGAVYGRGVNWVIENNEIHHNHGAGIKIWGSFTIRENYLHSNGQIGIVAVDAVASLFERNEVAFNNQLAASSGWEGGGTKFVRSYSLHLVSNLVHFNYGMGLWADIENDSIYFTGNIVEFNKDHGLMHEFGGSGLITCNLVRHNSLDSRYHMHNLYLSSVQGVEVTKNVVVVGNTRGDGIWVNHSLDRDIPGTDVWVHHNHITYTHTAAVNMNQAVSGYNSPDTTEAWYDSANVAFDYNFYHTPDTSLEHFIWRGILYSGMERTLEEFRAYGQEEHGTIDTLIGEEYSFSECAQYLDIVPTAGSVGPHWREPIPVTARSVGPAFAPPAEPANTATTRVYMYDMRGRLIRTLSVHKGKGEFPSAAPSGVYLIDPAGRKRKRAKGVLQ